MLLTACAHPVTVIDRDAQGRICRIEQPEDSRVEIPGEITVELREAEGEDFTDKIFKLGVGINQIGD